MQFRTDTHTINCATQEVEGLRSVYGVALYTPDVKVLTPVNGLAWLISSSKGFLITEFKNHVCDVCS